MFTLPEGSFDAYIFDNDGTLALSMDLHYQSWHQAYRLNGATFEFNRDIFHSLAGKGLYDTVETINRNFNQALDHTAVIKDQETQFLKKLHALKPNQPVVDFARQISRTHPVAVASGGPAPMVHKTLEVIGVSDLFEVVVTRDDVKRSKPAPDLLLLAAEKLGVNPAQCLVFEDSELGFESAKAANMTCVQVFS